MIAAISAEEQSLSKLLKNCTTFESILAKTDELKTLKAVCVHLLRRIGEKTVFILLLFSLAS
jgi:hypothetical protein